MSSDENPAAAAAVAHTGFPPGSGVGTLQSLRRALCAGHRTEPPGSAA